MKNHIWVQNKTTDDNKLSKLTSLLEESGFWTKLDAKCKKSPDCSIIIKPNISIALQKQLPNYTDPSLVNHLIDLLMLKKYKNVKIVESENIYARMIESHTPDNVGKNIGYKYPVTNLTTEPAYCEPYKQGEVCVGQKIKQADFLINFPKGRNHCQKKLTGALKNMFGAIPSRDKIQYHWNRNGISMEEAVVKVHEMSPSDFVIMDMIDSVDENDDHVSKKPINNRFHAGLLIAGEDPLLIDKYIAVKMGYDQNEPPITNLMAQKNGDIDIHSVHIHGDTLDRINDGNKLWQPVQALSIYKWDMIMKSLDIADRHPEIQQYVKNIMQTMYVDVIK